MVSWLAIKSLMVAGWWRPLFGGISPSDNHQPTLLDMYSPLTESRYPSSDVLPCHVGTNLQCFHVLHGIWQKIANYDEYFILFAIAM